MIDIFVNFFSAYQDEDQKVIDDLKKIAMNYFFGWFFIDLMSIFPFQWVMSSSGGSNADINGMAKIIRINRIGKLIRLTKLIRIIKILKA